MSLDATAAIVAYMDRMQESTDSSGNTLLIPEMSPAARWAVEAALIDNPNVFNLGEEIEAKAKALLIQLVLAQFEGSLITHAIVETIISELEAHSLAASPELANWLSTVAIDRYLVISGTF